MPLKNHARCVPQPPSDYDLVETAGIISVGRPYDKTEIFKNLGTSSKFLEALAPAGIPDSPD
jgi:hypothetical protein